MRFHCSVYNHDCTCGGPKGGDRSSGPWCQVQVATVTVSGRTPREAAARAYIACVGKERAKVMRAKANAPRSVIAQETNPKAIAASLRKTARGTGPCYEMDNFVQSWSITVEPASSALLPSQRLPAPAPRRLRLSHRLLHHLLLSPSPN